jgi:hypothetical protein
VAAAVPLAVAAVAAPGRRGRYAARLAAVATVALVVGACGDRPGTSTLVPRPSTVPLAATRTLAPTSTSAEAATTTPTGPLTAEERRWHQAFIRLADKLEQSWIDASTAEPGPALRSYANRLRGCRRELARIRPPSERFQPAYEMAKGACAPYDKAARCFAAAASITPAGPAEQLRQQRSVGCGIEAALEGSDRFAEATAEAQSVEDASLGLAP